MTAIMTHATRLPAATPVQITMSATIMIVRKAKPAIRVSGRFGDRTKLMAKGSNHINPSVSNTLETRKILGRIFKARLEERDFVLPEDVKALAAPILEHRMLLRPEFEMEGVEIREVIKAVLEAVEVPR